MLATSSENSDAVQGKPQRVSMFQKKKSVYTEEPMAYTAKPKHPAWDLFASLCTVRGSVIPHAALFALPCALLALALKLLQRRDIDDMELPDRIDDMEMIYNNAAYTGFSFIMGFLFVFRTSQAYSRFWEGVTSGHRMYAEWYDFASAVVAFSRYSKKDEEATEIFHHRLIRLMSLLHAAALATLRGIDGSSFELIDIGGLEDEILDRALLSDHPTTLVGQWLSELVMEGIEQEILNAPPPIVSRCFQEFANGMVAYHDALKIQNTQFPFPYTQMSAILLLAHWCVTPFVMCQWVKWPTWVFFLTLIQVLIFWALYFTAIEIEFPFKKGEFAESHQAAAIQHEFNQQLIILIERKTREIPRLSAAAVTNPSVLMGQHEEYQLRKDKSTLEKFYSNRPTFFAKLHDEVVSHRSNPLPPIIECAPSPAPMETEPHPPAIGELVTLTSRWQVDQSPSIHSAEAGIIISPWSADGGPDRGKIELGSGYIPSGDLEAYRAQSFQQSLSESLEEYGDDELQRSRRKFKAKL